MNFHFKDLFPCDSVVKMQMCLVEMFTGSKL